MNLSKFFSIPETDEIADSAFGFDFHQVAIYTVYPQSAVDLLSQLGFATWHKDSATLTGVWNGVHCEIYAEMFFNYQILHGKELEFVQYFRHPNPRYRDRISQPFISHLSAYVESIDEAKEKIRTDHGLMPFHEFETSNHKNPRVAGKKYFREAIFGTSDRLGFNLKLIEKVYT